MNNNDELKSLIYFEQIFDDYYKALNEYMRGGIIAPHEFHEFKFSHPTLFDLAIELHSSFFTMPIVIREKILKLNFEVFLHCNNPIDFYSFRIFLSDNNRFQKLTTIAERVDAEIKTAKKFIEKGIIDEYIHFPERNFSFYRSYYIDTNLVKEFEIQKIDNGFTGEGAENQKVEDKLVSQEDNTHKEIPGIFTEINTGLKKGDELVGNFGNLMNKLKGAIEVIKELVKINPF